MSKETSFTIHDLLKPERPRERLKKFGPEALSAQELLALVIEGGHCAYRCVSSFSP